MRKYYPSSHVLVKEPKTPESTLWHHDQPYYFVDGEQVCSIWLPLDPVPKESGLEFVAGSHLLGKMFMNSRHDICHFGVYHLWSPLTNAVIFPSI